MATDKQVSKLSHLLTTANLIPYSEMMISGKIVRTTQPFTEKLRGLSIEEASMLIGLFKPWEKSWEDIDLGFVRQFIKEHKLI